LVKIKNKCTKPDTSLVSGEWNAEPMIKKNFLLHSSRVHRIFENAWQLTVKAEKSHANFCSRVSAILFRRMWKAMVWWTITPRRRFTVTMVRTESHYEYDRRDSLTVKYCHLSEIIDTSTRHILLSYSYLVFFDGHDHDCNMSARISCLTANRPILRPFHVIATV